MSLHSYSRVWVHLIWATHTRQRVINKNARRLLHDYLQAYSEEKDIYMKINFVNPDHVHTLIDLPTAYSIEKAAQLLKGSSSRYMNEQKVIVGRFQWGRGYGAFSVSHSLVGKAAQYIANQEEHHKRVSFHQEYRKLVQAYGLKWYDDAG